VFVVVVVGSGGGGEREEKGVKLLNFVSFGLF
jgi:hypothetical protein